MIAAVNLLADAVYPVSKVAPPLPARLSLFVTFATFCSRLLLASGRGAVRTRRPVLRSSRIGSGVWRMHDVGRFVEQKETKEAKKSPLNR